MSLKALGDIAAQERNYPAACSLYRQSLAIRLELGESADTAESVEKLAAMRSLIGSLNGPRYCGPRQALRVKVSSQRSLDEHEDYKRNIDTARSALGEEAFRSIWERGQAMAPDQAIAYALQDGTD